MADTEPPAGVGEAPAAAAPAAGGGGGGVNTGLTVQGLPMIKPPYGHLAAINLDRGEVMWQTPHGDTPDNIRNHPALKGVPLPAKLGAAGAPGAIVTARHVDTSLSRSTTTDPAGSRSTSLPFTLPASAARAKPAPIDCAISATVTGPGNDFSEPSGRRIFGIKAGPESGPQRGV